MHIYRLRSFTLLVVVPVLVLLWPTTATGASRSLRCEYLERGPAGAAGNVLAVSGNDNVLIRREGERVLVGTSAANGPRDFEEVACAGEAATTTNVDRIVYRATAERPPKEHQFLLDERGGPLGPGASPEAADPEIEVEVDLPPQRQARPRVQLLAGEGRDSVELSGGAGRLRFALEPRPGSARPDPDLIVTAPPRTVEAKVHAGSGDDVLDARALDPDPAVFRSILLAGDAGDDALLGTKRGDQLQGGSGADRLHGRAGRDFLYPSAGADLTVGGPGNDFITSQRGSAERDEQPDTYLGSAGDDYISARLGGSDRIVCGGGFDEAFADREDSVRGSCEKVRGPAANRTPTAPRTAAASRRQATGSDAIATIEAPSIAAPQPAQRRSFAIFRSPPEGFPGSLRADAAAALRSRGHGLNPSLAQRAAPNPKQPAIWAIPGRGAICLYVTPGDRRPARLACASTATASSTGLSLHYPDASTFGLAPDGAEAAKVHGNPEPLPIKENAFAGRGRGLERLIASRRQGHFHDKVVDPTVVCPRLSAPSSFADDAPEYEPEGVCRMQ